MYGRFNLLYPNISMHILHTVLYGIWSIHHHSKLTAEKLASTESQVATSGDLTFSLHVACGMNLHQMKPKM